MINMNQKITWNMKHPRNRKKELETELTLKIRFLFSDSQAKPPLKSMFQTKTKIKPTTARPCVINVNGRAGTARAISFSP